MMVGVNNHSKETVNRIPPQTIGAEIGVWKGDSSAKFLKTNPKQLHLVDAWSLDAWFDNLSEQKQQEVLNKYSSQLGIDKTREAYQQYYDNVYMSVVNRFKQNNNVIIHRIDSKEWFKTTDVIFDWIYVDGDHSYDGCLYDLNASLNVVKPGGIIFGDDYGNKVEVKRAVDTFVEQHNLTLEVFAVNQFQINL